MTETGVTPFWLQKPCVLLNNMEIFPTKKMTQIERLNALTRLLIIVTIVLFCMKYEYTVTVFMLGLLLILCLWSTETKREGFGPKRGGFDPCHNCSGDSSLSYINTKYEVTPENQYSHVNSGLRSYTNAKYTVKPLYVPSPASEVWRQESRFCNEFSQYPNTYDMVPNTPESLNFSQPLTKCHFEDTYWVSNTPSTPSCPRQPRSALAPRQSAFMRDSLEYRNNIMGDYVDQIERTRQHNCVDFKPGRKTF